MGVEASYNEIVPMLTELNTKKCDFLKFDFITDTHMEDLRKEYDAGIQLIWCKTPEDKLPELVNILKCVGITMRGYRTKEYMDKLVGNVFRSNSLQEIA